MTDYRQVNRGAWESLATAGSSSSRPFGRDEVARSEDWLDPDGWLPWGQVESVLCLGAGGGQQAALFAAIGYRVTSVDISPSQLRLDRQAARALQAEVEVVEADLSDLSALRGRHFDLVYQAVSACYVPDVRRVYREVAAVIKPGGHYWVRHWNPVHLQLSEQVPWDGEAYRLTRTQDQAGPIIWRSADHGDGSEVCCWHYAHRIGDLIGGLGEAGLALTRFSQSTSQDDGAAPGSAAHLESYVPTFFTLLARSLVDGSGTAPASKPDRGMDP